MYVLDYKGYPGDYDASPPGYADYVWMTTIFPYMAKNRERWYRCPAAPPERVFGITNLNKTLGGANENGVYDFWTVTPKSRFSMGYNDWGVNSETFLRRGLGRRCCWQFLQGVGEGHRRGEPRRK